MALTPDNYEFAFVQMDHTPQGDTFVLQVTPRGSNKYLYRGKIWVDARDFAVTRIDAEPARNQSLWITRTHIDTRYAKFGDFWLPVHNESVTHVRFGGDAVLKIDYKGYEINGPSQVRNARPSDRAPIIPPANAVAGDPH